MCGIFGAIFQGRPEVRHKAKVVRVVEALAAFNVSRGTDATGLAVVTSEHDYQLFRMTKPSLLAIQEPGWDEVLASVADNTVAILGHTRQGTHGDNTDENAHPFSEGSVIGTHNGTITNFWKLSGITYENDSRSLFSHLGLTERGSMGDMVTSITKLMEDVEGNFALAFVVGGLPVLLRNSLNPCYYVSVPKLGNAVLYSSEAGHLKMALAYAGIRDEVPITLVPWKLYAFPWGQTEPVLFELPERTYSYGGASSSYSSQTYSHTATVSLPGPVEEPKCTLMVKDKLGVNGTRAGERFTEYVTNFDVAIRCGVCDTVTTTRTLRQIDDRAICLSCFSDRLFPNRCDSCQQYRKVYTVFRQTGKRKLCEECFDRENVHVVNCKVKDTSLC